MKQTFMKYLHTYKLQFQKKFDFPFDVSVKYYQSSLSFFLK